MITSAALRRALLSALLAAIFVVQPGLLLGAAVDFGVSCCCGLEAGCTLCRGGASMLGCDDGSCRLDSRPVDGTTESISLASPLRFAVGEGELKPPPLGRGTPAAGGPDRLSSAPLDAPEPPPPRG